MKEKISITLDEELLEKVDSLVDNVRITNRSQAIEMLVRDSLVKTRITKAIILVGGSRERLVCGKTYKPLVKIYGEEIIKHQVKTLSRHGVNEIFIVGGFLLDEIKNILSDGKELAVSIKFLDDKNSGTAGAVKAAKNVLSGDFFVIFGDVFFDFDLEKMVSFHNAHQGNIATIAVTSTQLKESRDRIEIEGNKIIGFEYVPRERSFIVNASVFIFRPAIFEVLPEKGSLEKDVFPKLSKEGKLLAYNFSGKWKHINLSSY